MSILSKNVLAVRKISNNPLSLCLCASSDNNHTVEILFCRLNNTLTIFNLAQTIRYGKTDFLRTIDPFIDTSPLIAGRDRIALFNPGHFGFHWVPPKFSTRQAHFSKICSHPPPTAWIISMASCSDNLTLACSDAGIICRLISTASFRSVKPSC